VYGFSAVEYSLYAGRRGYTTPLGFIVGLELAIFVQPISFDTFSLWPAPGRVLLSSAITRHSPDKEKVTVARPHEERLTSNNRHLSTQCNNRKARFLVRSYLNNAGLLI
jgi:hypothetical protein